MISKGGQLVFLQIWRGWQLYSMSLNQRHADSCASVNDTGETSHGFHTMQWEFISDVFLGKRSILWHTKELYYLKKVDILLALSRELNSQILSTLHAMASDIVHIRFILVALSIIRIKTMFITFPYYQVVDYKIPTGYESKAPTILLEKPKWWASELIF